MSLSLRFFFKMGDFVSGEGKTYKRKEKTCLSPCSSQPRVRERDRVRGKEREGGERKVHEKSRKEVFTKVRESA